MGKVIIVNLFGGPGTGKSTTAAGVFAKLKMQNINCELVQEFAKHVVWRGNFTTLNNQLYIFAKQHDRLFHLKDKVDIIITDSPTIMGLTLLEKYNLPYLVMDANSEISDVLTEKIIEIHEKEKKN